MNETNNEEIELNGVTYVRKDSVAQAKPTNTDGMPYVICRGHECGVHAGFLKEHDGNHATQKPVQLLQRLISIFSDEGEVVIDPVCGSGSTLLAAQKMSRKSYGFEVDRNFFNAAKDSVLSSFEPDMFQMLKYENTIMNPPYAGGKN